MFTASSSSSRLIGAETLASISAGLVVAIAVALIATVNNPLRSAVQTVLAATWLAALVAVVILSGIAIAAYRMAGKMEAAAGARPEPLLSEPNLPPVRRPRPLVTLCAVEPGAGASTLSFNLGVLLAAEGLIREGEDRRRPRSVCLLQAGALTQRLGLDPEPLADYLTRNPVSISDELIGLAIRYPSGCELLCLADGVLNGHRLKQLLPVLRRYYDLILLDCPTGDRWLSEVAVDLSELVLAVALPSLRSAAAAAAWADEGWRRGAEGKTALVVNRIESVAPVPAGLVDGFLHRVQLPEDPLVAASDLHGLPWALAIDSDASRELAQAGGRAFSLLLAEERAIAV